jgi:hypothetical protein
MKSELWHRRGATCGNDDMSSFELCFGLGRVGVLTWCFLAKSESPDHMDNDVMTITRRALLGWGVLFPSCLLLGFTVLVLSSVVECCAWLMFCRRGSLGFLECLL